LCLVSNTDSNTTGQFDQSGNVTLPKIRLSSVKINLPLLSFEEEKRWKEESNESENTKI
jgi:hypothetical protein